MLKPRVSLKIFVALVVILAGIYSLPNTARATIPNQKIIYSEIINPGSGTSTLRLGQLDPQNPNDNQTLREGDVATLPSFSPDGTKIMYLYSSEYFLTSETQRSIVVSEPDNSNPQYILQDFYQYNTGETIIGMPQWGSNTKLYFATVPQSTWNVSYNDSTQEDGYIKIYSVDVDGSGLTELYKLLPDSDKHYYSSDHTIDYNESTNSIVFFPNQKIRSAVSGVLPSVVTNNKIYSLNLSNLELDVLATAPNGKNFSRFPNLSPDGKKLVYSLYDISQQTAENPNDDGTLNILNLETNQNTEVGSEDSVLPAVEFSKPDQIWSQDSSKFIYVDYVPDQQGVDIKVYDLNTGQINDTGYRSYIPFAIFTDNDQRILASIIIEQQGWDLALIDLNTNNHINLTNKVETGDFWADIYPRNIDTDVEINNPPPDLSNIKPPRTGESTWVYVSLFGVFGLMILVGYSSVRFTNKLLYRNKGVR